jgi:hypothetical protein
LWLHRQNDHVGSGDIIGVAFFNGRAGTSLANAFRASALGSQATIALAGTISARTKPRASAVAIRPAPIKPILIESIASTMPVCPFLVCTVMVREQLPRNNDMASRASGKTAAKQAIGERGDSTNLGAVWRF